VLILFIAIYLISGCKKDNPDNSNSSGETVENESFSTFTDPRDGETYDIVKIGNQYWFAENLRYSGNIPEVSGNSNWDTITNTAAWCYFNDIPSNNANYGKLYNWYTFNDGGLCPDGWHVPSDSDWDELMNYLGGEEVAGGKMKSITGWSGPNVDATNSSGFSALPSGFRYGTGEFQSGGVGGAWWSTTVNGTDLNYTRNVSSNNGHLQRATSNWKGGRSCRCVKD
jgi:uncharacterized protein (TIGR02145 family)